MVWVSLPPTEGGPETRRPGRSRAAPRLVRPSQGVPRLSQGVHDRKKPLGELVQLALTGLIGFDGDQGVVAALRLRGDGELADGPGEPALSGGFPRGREATPEKAGRPGDHQVGGEGGAVEVFHGSDARTQRRKDARDTQQTTTLRRCVVASLRPTPFHTHSTPPPGA